MYRHRDCRDRFTPTTNSPTTPSSPTHGVVRATPSTNPSVGRIAKRGRSSIIITSRSKGKEKVGEGSSKDRVSEASQEAVILSSQEEPSDSSRRIYTFQVKSRCLE
jgi:hypothetical protein